MSRAPVLIAALLLAATGLLAGEEDLAAVRGWQRDTLADLAERAATAGHPVLARRCLIHATRAGVTVAEPDNPDAVPRLSERKRAKLEKELAAYRVEAAKKLAALAEADEDRPLAEEARRLDPTNARARKALGQVLVKGWGWLPAEDAKRLKSGLLPVGDEWLPKKEVPARGANWSKAVTVTSDHYRIRSNLPLKRTFLLRDLLEAFHAKFREDWEGILPLQVPGERHEVLIFATKGAYEGHLEATDPQRVLNVPGQYSPNLKRSAFYDVETHRSGSNQTSTLTELMLHEITHQLVYEEVESRPQALEGASAPNFWLHEGIAEYYGLHTLKKGSVILDRKAVGKMLRTVWLRERKDQLASLAELDAMGRQAFLAGGEQRLVNYAGAGFLCMFLATEYPSAFREAVRKVYCENNPPKLLATLVDEDLAKLDRSFRAFLRRL